MEYREFSKYRASIYVLALIMILFPMVFLCCAIIPAYTHSNVRLHKEATSPPQNKTLLSGSYLASDDVQWKLKCKCRNEWMPNSLSPLTPVKECEMDDNNFVGIAISGGGIRSAVFSAAVLFELERYGILQNVDVISSVSGGSFTAAFYALSCDNPKRCPPTLEGPNRFTWKPEVVFSKLEANFLSRWIWNWFWPDNILRFWFTCYDRSDVMVETVADNLFDNSLLGGEGFRFQDLNPQKPYLLINATNNTMTDEYKKDVKEDLLFSFTREQFDQLESNLDQYPIANAVVTSAAFPGAFHYTTLKDFSKTGEHYIHLFDGGTSDNLGLTSLERTLRKTELSLNSKVLIILIDAYTPIRGENRNDPDVRSFIDYFVDTNFLDAYDTLMAIKRKDEIENFKKYLQMKKRKNYRAFVHLTFDDLIVDAPDIFEIVSNIPTSLNINYNQANCLRRAARPLVEKATDVLEHKHKNLWNDLGLFKPDKNQNDDLPSCKPNLSKKK